MSKRVVIQVLLVLASLAAGAGVLLALKATKPEAERAEREATALLVETVRVERKRHEVSLRAQGTVIPARRVLIQPEISGSVTWKNPDLVPGGRIQKGKPLVRIDPRDYELAVKARKAEVSRAELELRMERSRREVAQREWEKFGGDSADTDGGTLALRDPQLRTAQVGVRSAESALEQAQLNLSKSTIRAPFNAMVMEENVDTGQLVGPQANVAVLVGTDQYWVQVSVPVEALASIRARGTGGADTGSAAKVWQQVGADRVERPGEVVRVLPDLDPGGSMARLIVAIDDPLGLDGDEGDAALPLLLNSYVNVEIEAPPIEGVIEVPRAALREGNQVYVMDDGDRLRIRTVSIAWRRPDAVLVREGLRDGERLITSRVPAPVDGMLLRRLEGEEGAQAVAEAADAEAEAEAPPRSREKL
jgi:RND family efflux transporter MFP subunit